MCLPFYRIRLWKYGKVHVYRASGVAVHQVDTFSHGMHSIIKVLVQEECNKIFLRVNKQGHSC